MPDLPQLPTLLERMEWVLREIFGGGDGAQTAWSLKTGKGRTKVGHILTRLRKNPDSKFEVETLKVLATAAPVPFWWLAGEAPPELTVDPDERYPHRGEAVECARRAGYAERAIADIQAEQLHSNEDPPVRWWLERIQERERQLLDPFLSGPPGHAPDNDDV